jgi:hypothetical protein
MWCIFWQDYGDWGFCRRSAPIAIPVVTGQADTRTAWPKVSRWEWCGQFEPRTDDTLTGAAAE